MRALTKGSRFWTFAPWVWVASVPMSIHFNDASVFTQVSVVFLGLGGAKSVVSSYRGNGGEAL